ncbi:MAG: (E)-4-hydroxy-3-methylbut-2-enyl-diphosphate synthase, partial [Bacteroidetes bacterium]|nr:(E)-4-hydroxy-3-methylbut-2-enyl-diphosphate synthase [Bacteroidota bacterium]
MPYCESLTNYVRRVTHEVNVAHIPMGGLHPVRIQTMTDTLTRDTQATIEQCKRLAGLDVDYIRITCPSLKDVQHLETIKKALLEHSINVPIVADIHFSPQAAYEAAKVVDKIRINPGNYTDKKTMQPIQYSTEAYLEEIDRLKTVFTPLLEVCKEYQTPMRIGVNHGSLSDRIMSKYGDTPEGMVESALEFLRICKENDFKEVVISMKASNTIVMVQANRLLVHKMRKEDMHFPLHLGVTEAGNGEDGRIKSALGIGALLADGIGETIRVSLTEDPAAEIPVARKLVQHFKARENHDPIPPIENYMVNPYEYKKRKSHEVLTFGNFMVPKVMADLRSTNELNEESLREIGWKLSAADNKWEYTELAADFLVCSHLPAQFPTQKGILIPFNEWKTGKKHENVFPLASLQNQEASTHEGPLFLEITLDDITDNPVLKDILSGKKDVIIVFRSRHIHAVGELRYMFNYMFEHSFTHPVVLQRAFEEKDMETFQLQAACDLGTLFIDGPGDGIWLSHKQSGNDGLILSTSFGILQACRARTYKTDYISCPGCGRTLFDLQKTTEIIK